MSPRKAFPFLVLVPFSVTVRRESAELMITIKRHILLRVISAFSPFLCRAKSPIMKQLFRIQCHCFQCDSMEFANGSKERFLHFYCDTMRTVFFFSNWQNRPTRWQSFFIVFMMMPLIFRSIRNNDPEKSHQIKLEKKRENTLGFTVSLYFAHIQNPFFAHFFLLAIRSGSLALSLPKAFHSTGLSPVLYTQ